MKFNSVLGPELRARGQVLNLIEARLVGCGCGGGTEVNDSAL